MRAKKGSSPQTRISVRSGTRHRGCDEKTLTARISREVIELDMTKGMSDNLKWACWNRQLTYPGGLSVVLEEFAREYGKKAEAGDHVL